MPSAIPGSWVRPRRTRCRRAPAETRYGRWRGRAPVTPGCVALHVSAHAPVVRARRRRGARVGRGATPSVAGALLDPRRELLDLFEGLAALCDLVADLLVGVHDRGVV